ncbi:related to Origin recognition complex subunit 4 [Sporisorium reilianum SRZ2]|uniref:Related to Origin recognition complex subunit 4 n=1 Tax=Sporisorium reilianum (strain SRZ2) TaxID=999809 RepID=E6ZLE9_SPORE|nr:related to Origin recognition complex subunit 4 [Sporisorium reilianum SRZ2]
MTRSKRKATDSPPVSPTDDDQTALDIEPASDAPIDTAHPARKRANLSSSSSEGLAQLPLQVLEPLLPLQKQHCLHTLVGHLPPIPAEPAPPIASTSTLASAGDDDDDDDGAVFDDPPSRSTADDRTRLEAAACVGLEDDWHTLHAMLSATVTAQESNSCLLIGASGSGKSLLVDSVLDSICKRHVADSKPYYHVHLAGTVQINDRSAMKEMAQQLILQGAFTEQDVGDAIDAPSLDDDEDSTPAPATGADHVFGGDDDDDDGEAAHAAQLAAAAAADEAEIQDELAGAILSSLNNIIANIIALLSNTASTSASNSTAATGGGRKPLIITLDDFDLFTARPRQAMLYCLLDAVQAASYGAGLAVVGVTSRVDTVDLLEKRVKSRFSHRILHVRPPASFDVFERIVRNALSPLPPSTPSLSTIPTAHTHAFTQAWQREVAALLAHPHVRDVLRGIYELSNDMRMVYRILTPTLCRLSLLDPALDATTLLETAALEVGDGTLHVLRDLTEPELALLIAIKHLQTRDRAVFNFEMCFDELARFAARDARERHAASSDTLAGLAGSAVATPFLADRKIALMSFHSLLALELVLPENSIASLSIANPVAKPSAATGGNTGRTNQATIRKEFWKVRCVLAPTTIVNAVKDRHRPIAISSSLVKWASSHG